MRRVELIPGWTAARWWAIMLVVSCVGILPIAAIALSVVRLTDDSQIVLAVVGVAVISVLEYFPIFKMQATQRREAVANYTSLWWPKDLTLDQVDPVTGVVIREGGTPRLTSAQYREARAKALNPLAF